jgi:hypothetical protein
MSSTSYGYGPIGTEKKKTWWDWLTDILSIINIFALTGVISILATASFIGTGNLPLWFAGSMFAPGFFVLAATEGLAACAALFNIFRYSFSQYIRDSGTKKRHESILGLVSSLITFFGSGAACAGAILLASGVVAANPAAALAVSVLFIAALTLVAIKNVFQALYNRLVLHKNLKPGEKVTLILTCSLACAVSALGIFALIAKLLLAAAFTVGMGWAAAGGLGVLLIVAACAHLACKEGSVAKQVPPEDSDIPSSTPFVPNNPTGGAPIKQHNTETPSFEYYTIKDLENGTQIIPVPMQKQIQGVSITGGLTDEELQCIQNAESPYKDLIAKHTEDVLPILYPKTGKYEDNKTTSIYPIRSFATELLAQASKDKNNSMLSTCLQNICNNLSKDPTVNTGIHQLREFLEATDYVQQRKLPEQKNPTPPSVSSHPHPTITE